MKKSPTDLALRAAIFSCFVAHGIVAIQASGNYGSEWSAWVRSLLDPEHQYELSSIILKTVGAIDVSAGLMFLAPRVHPLAIAWAIFWGASTTLSRLYFLGVHIPPFEFNGLHALSEFLIRTPNWMLPVFFFAGSEHSKKTPFNIPLSLSNGIVIAIWTQMVGILLHCVYEYNSPYFQLELSKFGMPAWYFQALTAGSLISVFLIGFNQLKSVRLPLKTLAFVLATATYAMTEGFQVFMLNARSGFVYTFLRVLEHVPIYISFALWIKQTTREPSKPE
ncbi:MAG: hypothetical protein WCO71_09440 [Pseudomonadota bacterium]